MWLAAVIAGCLWRYILATPPAAALAGLLPRTTDISSAGGSNGSAGAPALTTHSGSNPGAAVSGRPVSGGPSTFATAAAPQTEAVGAAGVAAIAAWDDGLRQGVAERSKEVLQVGVVQVEALRPAGHVDMFPRAQDVTIISEDSSRHHTEVDLGPSIDSRGC
jgi:hypothetical protein